MANAFLYLLGKLDALPREPGHDNFLLHAVMRVYKGVEVCVVPSEKVDGLAHHVDFRQGDGLGGWGMDREK